MRAYLSSRGWGALCVLLLLQRVLTRIGLAQCAYTNAVFCDGWYPESSRFLDSVVCSGLALASCKTLGMKQQQASFYELYAILGLLKRIGDPFRRC